MIEERAQEEKLEIFQQKQKNDQLVLHEMLRPGQSGVHGSALQLSRTPVANAQCQRSDFRDRQFPNPEHLHIVSSFAS